MSAVFGRAAHLDAARDELGFEIARSEQRRLHGSLALLVERVIERLALGRHERGDRFLHRGLAVGVAVELMSSVATRTGSPATTCSTAT